MLWEHQDNHKVDWLLVWSLQLNQLYASNLNMTQAQGLSDYNHRLLLQKQAVGQPANDVIKDEYHNVQLMNFYRQGVAYREKGDNDKAIDAFQKCHQLDASFLPAFGESAWCWVRKSVDHKKHRKQAEKIFHWIKDEGDPVISVRYALFLIYQNRWKDAVDWLKQCLLLSQCADITFNECDVACLYEINGLEEEIHLRKNFTIASMIFSHYLLVMVYIQQEEDRLAIDILRLCNIKAIDLLYDQKISEPACSLLGRANRDVGDEAMANAWFAFALLLSPQHYNHEYSGYQAEYAGWKISRCVFNLIEQWLTAADNAISIEPKDVSAIYTSILKLHLLAYSIREGFNDSLVRQMELIGENNEPEFHPILFHILARCYHVIAKRAMKESNVSIQKSASVLAHNYFLSALKGYREINGGLFSSFCFQYGLFLLYINEINDAVENLELAITLIADESDVNYFLLDKDIAYDNLHSVIEEEGEISIKASLMAYYVLISLYQNKVNAALASSVEVSQEPITTCLNRQRELITQLGQEASAEATETMSMLPLQLLAAAFETMGLTEVANSVRQSMQSMEVTQLQVEQLSQQHLAAQMRQYQRHGLFGRSARNDDESNALDVLYNNDQVKNVAFGRKK